MNTGEELIRKAYKAFNERDAETVLALMQPNVQWPNGWEGGYVQGRDAVKEYWTRQWKEINPVVTPVNFYRNDKGQIEVTVHQTVKDVAGNLMFDGELLHVYTITNGYIETMQILNTQRPS